MKLYCFGESGHSYKAALALQLAEIDWTPIFVIFSMGKPGVTIIEIRSTKWAKRPFW